MQKLIAHELHKQLRRNFQRRRVELKGINDLLQLDVVDLPLYTKYNRGYRYILTAINCFTKYAYAVPIKNKTGVLIKKALEPILESNKIRLIQTDNGTEFYNSTVQALFKKYNLRHYSSYTEKKASIVERFNRTLKNNMWREFSARGSYKWLDILDDLVAKYNNSYHRTIRMKPVEVNNLNEKQVLENINKSTFRKPSGRRSKFKIGDVVRISKYKKTFEKGYQPNFTNEQFTVSSILPTTPITYRLKDSRNQIIKGAFYEYEMIKTKYPNVYLVEKIVRKKGDKSLVKWLGFDQTHNSWINTVDIV